MYCLLAVSCIFLAFYSACDSLDEFRSKKLTSCIRAKGVYSVAGITCTVKGLVDDKGCNFTQKPFMAYNLGSKTDTVVYNGVTYLKDPYHESNKEIIEPIGPEDKHPCRKNIGKGTNLKKLFKWMVKGNGSYKPGKIKSCATYFMPNVEDGRYEFMVRTAETLPRGSIPNWQTKCGIRVISEYL